MGTVRHLPLADVPPAKNAVEPVRAVRSHDNGSQDPDSGSKPIFSLPSATEDGERLLQVGELARASGKTVRAIHHYEDVGLLRPHARSKGRYRLYDQAAITRIRWIGKLHDLGLSLGAIQQIVKSWEAAPSAPGAMAEIRRTYQQKLEETRAQIAHLSSLERELVASIDYLDTCDSCDPAELVAACTDCHVHDPAEQEPELVAGIHGGAGRRKNGGGPLCMTEREKPWR
jgi:MerR family copper efflux transcriptional regulator